MSHTDDEIILALDPGVARVGWAIMSKKNNETTALEYGCIETKSTELLEKRLHIIHEKLARIIATYRPATLVMERLFFKNNQKTAITVGQAQGVMILLAAQNKMPVHFITPMHIKQALTNHGAADKQQVQKMVMMILGFTQTPALDDTVDALACGITYFATIRL